MKGKHFLVATLLATGYFFSACSDRTVATTDQYPADETGTTTTGTTTGTTGTDVAGADTGYEDDEYTREDVANTGSDFETDRMSAGTYDEAAFAELPSATQQLVMPMQDMMQQMRSVDISGNNLDEAFAQMMILHHQGAINMAHQVMQSGDNDDITDRARQMVSTKQQEIDQLQEHSGNKSGTSGQQGTTTVTTGRHGTNDRTGTSGTATGDPMQQLRGATEGTMEQLQQESLNGDPDHDFAHIMILHHQDAIEMAEVVLQHGENQEVKTIAQQIVDNNRRQIQELDTWRRSNDR